VAPFRWRAARRSSIRSELGGQRRLVEQPRRLELRPGSDHPLADHRHAQVTLTRRGAIQQPGQAETARGGEHTLDMAGRQRPLDPERVPGAHKRLTAQRPRQRLDRRRRQLRHVRDRLVANPAALPERTPHQMRHIHPTAMPPHDLGHMHRRHNHIMTQLPDSKTRKILATQTSQQESAIPHHQRHHAPNKPNNSWELRAKARQQ